MTLSILAVDFSAIFRRHVASSSDQVFSSAFDYTLRDIEEHARGYDRVAICCDGPRNKSFRRAMFPEYKAHREATPREVIFQGRRAIEALRAKGYTVLRAEEYEADDIIATVCAWAVERNHTVGILGIDKDLRQCLNPAVAMVNPSTGEVTTAEDLAPLEPHQVPMWLALMGDSSDNVPGVPGIGDKTAKVLLAQHGTLEGIYLALDSFTPKKREALEQNKAALYQALELTKLRDNVPLELDGLEGEPVPTVAHSVTETNNVDEPESRPEMIPPPADSRPQQVASYPAPEMQWSPQIGELAAALAKAQGEIQTVAKDKRANAGKYGYTYAGLGDIITATRPLAKHGISVVQMPHQRELVTLLAHASGQWLRCTTPIEYKGGGPQAYGSAVTYARRYALMAICGVPLDEDDDGAQAQAGYQNRRAG